MLGPEPSIPPRQSLHMSGFTGPVVAVKCEDDGSTAEQLHDQDSEQTQRAPAAPDAGEQQQGGDKEAELEADPAQRWVQAWRAASVEGLELRTRLAARIGDGLLEQLAQEVAVAAVRELADTFIAHEEPYVRVDPFVQILSLLAEGVVPALCRGVAREAVTEIANEILLQRRCEIALRGLEEEAIADLLHSTTLFEEAAEEEDMAQALGALLGEALDEAAREEATAALQVFESEARQVHGDFQRMAVDRAVRRVLSTRVALGHLMMSISNHFGAVLLEHHTYSVALRLAAERALAHLYAAEERLDDVSESDVCGHAFAEAAVPGAREELVRLLLAVSRELEEAVDEAEERHRAAVV